MTKQKSFSRLSLQWFPEGRHCKWTRVQSVWGTVGDNCRLVRSSLSWLEISSSWLIFRRSWQASIVPERERNIITTVESVVAGVSCAIKSRLGAKSHGLKLAGSKGLLIQVFIIFFHSLHKPATLVQIHTQHQGRAGPWWRLMGSVQATLAANQVRFPGTGTYTSLWASNVLQIRTDAVYNLDTNTETRVYTIHKHEHL